MNKHNKKIHDWLKRIFVLLLLYESLCYIITTSPRFSLSMIIKKLTTEKKNTSNPKTKTETKTKTTILNDDNDIDNKNDDERGSSSTAGIVGTNTDNDDLHYLPSSKLKYPKPTYLVTIKSPRSGSTFLQKTLLAQNDPYLFLSWEGTPNGRAKQHFQSCESGKIFDEYTDHHHQNRHQHKKKKQQMIKPYYNGGALSNETYNDILYNQHPWTCAVAINGYLSSEQQWNDINNLILQYNAKVIFQLRTNVVEKAISRSKKFNGLYEQKEGHDYNGRVSNNENNNNNNNPSKMNSIFEYTYTIPISNEIVQFAMEGLSTIENHILSETQYLTPLLTKNKKRNDVDDDDIDIQKEQVAPSRLQSSSSPQLLYVWYEDMIRQCSETIRSVYELIGRTDSIPIETLNTTCQTSHFQQESDYPTNLVNALKTKEELIPMINSYRYNMEVDTDAIYQHYKNKAQKANITFGLWR